MNVPEPAHAPVATLAELPFYLAERFDRPVLLRRCVGDGFEDFSTRDFVDQVRALSLGLQRFGIERGDRVGLVCESRPEWSIADLAILTAGAVNVPVYPTLSATQTQFILHDAGVKLVVVSDDIQLAKLLGLAPELPALTAVVVVAPAAPLPARQPGAPEVHALREVVAEGLARVAGDASLARQHEEQARRLSGRRHRHDHLHVGNDGPSEGRRAHAPEHPVEPDGGERRRADPRGRRAAVVPAAQPRLRAAGALPLPAARLPGQLRRIAADRLERPRAGAAHGHDRRPARVREVPSRGD